MTITLPAFTPLEDSLFLTLCCRALDNRSKQPILADAMADEIVRKLDYDYRKLNISKDLMLNATLRAKKLDEVASRLLVRHPNAIGLDLGSILERSASTRRPLSIGTTSTFRRLRPLANASYRNARTLMPSEQT